MSTVHNNHYAGLSASSFLESHRTLGALYEPLMCTFLLVSLLSPVWLTYIIYLSFFSLINHLITQGTLLEYKPRIKKFCTQVAPYYNNIYLALRITADGLLNPSFLVLYPLCIEYFFANTDTMHGLTYTNKLGQLSYYSKPYFIAAITSYWVWVASVHTFLKSQKLTYLYESNLLTRFFSPSRIFGSAVIYIVIFDFNNTIDHLLWTNIYTGTALASTTFLYRLICIYNLKDVPKYRQ